MKAAEWQSCLQPKVPSVEVHGGQLCRGHVHHVNVPYLMTLECVAFVGPRIRLRSVFRDLGFESLNPKPLSPGLGVDGSCEYEEIR